MCTEAAPIKCDGRESAGRPTDSHIESAGRPTDSLTESVGKPADSLPSHFIGAASGLGPHGQMKPGGRIHATHLLPFFACLCAKILYSSQVGVWHMNIQGKEGEPCSNI